MLNPFYRYGVLGRTSLQLCLFVLIIGSTTSATLPKHLHDVHSQDVEYFIGPSRCLESILYRRANPGRVPGNNARERLVYDANQALSLHGYPYLFDAYNHIWETRGEDVVRELQGITWDRYILHELSLCDGTDFYVAIEGGQRGPEWGITIELPVVRISPDSCFIQFQGAPRAFDYKAHTFTLDRYDLVDSTLTNITRSWMVPWAGIGPDGLSSDGKKLLIKIYFDRFFGDESPVWWKVIDNYESYGNTPFVILSIDADGTLSFEDSYELLLHTKRENLTDFPHDPRDIYLRYTKFIVDGNTYIVKWEMPMT